MGVQCEILNLAIELNCSTKIHFARPFATLVSPGVQTGQHQLRPARSNDDPDVWILYENWKTPFRSCGAFPIALHEGKPSGVARGARKRNGFAALFDGYEDCMKEEEKSWHGSFACTNMVMPAY